MYDYDSAWTDAAVRRLVRRLDGVDRDLLFALRRADNAASGVGPAGDANQDELEARIAEQLEAEPALLVDRRLAIDGHDLQRELGMPPGPEIGAVLDRLTEIVLDDPTQNRRDILLDLARGAVTARTADPPRPEADWRTPKGTLLQSAVRTAVRIVLIHRRA